MAFVTDPIADLLTRIRNAQTARHADVVLPGSKIKLEVAKRLAQYGYVESVQWIEEGYQGQIRIVLKYDNNSEPIIRDIRRISKPSRRVYVGVQDIPQVLNGLGIAILSTSRGVMSDREARTNHIGGELLCSVY